jgi:effector-binding domain-containing protein
MSPTRSTGLACLLAASVAGAPQQSTPQPSKPAPPPTSPQPAPPADPVAPDNKVATTDALHVLVLPMKGSYMQHQSAFERVGGFLAGKGVSPLGPPIARYLSDPSVGEADLVWEVGVPVPGAMKAEPPFEIKDIPGSLTAIHVHKGSYEELATAWPAFVQWVLSNGYRPVGTPMQIFQGNFGSSSQVEMRIPVEK